MSKTPQRYRSLSSWLKETFGEPVRKIALDAGFSCPNRDGALGSAGCLYCNPRGSGTGALAAGIPIREQVDRAIAFLSRRYGSGKFIAYFQSFTNTYADPARLQTIYAEALRRPEVVGLAIGTRPDCVPDEVLDMIALLAEGRLVWIEYGLQSIHSRSLRLIRRGHGPEAFFDAVARTRQRRVGTVAHLILGLPGESLDDMRETAIAVGRAGVDGVKLHPLYVVAGTDLEKLAKEGGYEPLTEEQAQEAIITVLAALPPEVVIHRLTSDPHREELVAPTWMLDRNGVRRRLEQALEHASLVQGTERTSRLAREGDRERTKSEAMPKEK
ncbi:MAG: TIGR01212 family radical SAM protein [Desulfomonile tiedjei]|nr:TIGR01212 family radical SAM protein [Desulfomonile tiedjei]